MKKTKILALLLAMLLLPAIGLAQNKDAATYENAEAGLSFTHPAGWVDIGSDVLGDEEWDTITDQLNVPRDMIDTALAGVLTYLFDIGGAKDGFVPNLNVIATDMPGLTDEMIADPAFGTQMKTVLEAQMSQANGTLTWVEDPTAKTFGEHTALFSNFMLEMGDLNVAECQIIMTNGKQMFVFTYATHPDGLDDATLQTLESLVESVTFA